MSLVTVSTPRLHRLSAPRIRHHEAWQRGFTLLEMLLVLFLMALVASAGLMLTEGVEDQAKYDETKRRMALIRTAIVGDPTRTVNGTPEISGFVADMGRLPNDLRELTEQAYCYTTGYVTEVDCTTNGGTWHEAASYALYYWCSNPLYLTQSDCTTNGASWGPNPANLMVGWRGPYVQAQPEQNGYRLIRDGYGNSGDNTEGLTADVRSAGWLYQITGNNLSLTSVGFEVNNNADDIQDSGFIVEDDWMIDITGGVDARFLKPFHSIVLVSKCSDPTKTSKSACSSPLTWYGGCNKAGYFNKDSCTLPPASGTWTRCSDGTNPVDSSACLFPKIWFGDGYGCSDQQKTTKAECSGPTETWRSCSDGTSANKDDCLSAGENWFGDTLYSQPQSSSNTISRSLNICMIIYYRDAETIAYAMSDPIPVKEDGTEQTFHFTGFDDGTNPVNLIPAGSQSIGIYEYDGDCNPDNNLYPYDRTKPASTQFQPRSQVTKIDW